MLRDSEAAGDENDGSGNVEESAVILGEYRLVMRLGEGGFGTVYLAIHLPTMQKYAVKVISSSILKVHHLAERVRREATIMQALRHPHVLSLYQVLHLENAILFVMEYAPSGELFDLLVERGHFSERTGRRYFQQLISALHYCHSHSVAHGDLKVENLLLDDDLMLKVSDFNLAMEANATWQTDSDVASVATAGTLAYMCPELILQDHKTYDPFRADLYAVGVCLYFMLVGSLPFDDVDEEALEQRILANIYDPTLIPSPEARSLIAQLLAKDPAKRATMKDVMTHPWFLIDLDPNLFSAGDVNLFTSIPLQSPVSQGSFSGILHGAFSTMDSVSRGYVTEQQFKTMLSSTLHKEKQASPTNSTSSLARSPEDTRGSQKLQSSSSNEALGRTPTTEDPAQLDLLKTFFPKGVHSISFFDFVARWDQCDPTQRMKLLGLLPSHRAPKRAPIPVGSKERSHELSQLTQLLHPAFELLAGRSSEVVTLETLKRKFAKAHIQCSDEELEGLISDITRDTSSSQFTFGEFLDAICEDDILSKNLLGGRLASLLGLTCLLRSKECLEYVRHGFLAAGTPDALLAKIRETPGFFFRCCEGQSMSPCTCSRPECVRYCIQFLRAFASPEKSAGSSSGKAGGPMTPEALPPLSTSAPKYLSAPMDAALLTKSPKDDNLATSPQLPSTKDPAFLNDLTLSPSLMLNRRASAAPPFSCEFDVHFSPACAVEGYTEVRFTRVVGSTTDYHEAIRSVARVLECEREQAEFDSSARGESELM